MSLGTSFILQLIGNAHVLGQHLDQHDNQSFLEVLINIIFLILPECVYCKFRYHHT